MWHGYWSAGDWVWMALVMVVFWGLVVAGIVWLVRRAGGAAAPIEPPDSGQGPTAQQILDERYARGEISEEEYRHRRDLLRTH